VRIKLAALGNPLRKCDGAEFASHGSASTQASMTLLADASLIAEAMLDATYHDYLGLGSALSELLSPSFAFVT
jgi:hypothetical protein